MKKGCFYNNNKKQKKLLPSIGGHKTNFNALFRMLKLGRICCSFVFELVYISLIQAWERDIYIYIYTDISTTRPNRPSWPIR